MTTNQNASQPTPEQCIEKLENIARVEEPFDPAAARLAQGYANILRALTPSNSRGIES